MPRLPQLAKLLLLTSLAAAAQDQPKPADLLRSVTLEPARRQALEKAIAGREYGTAETLLAEEAERQPESQPVLLALAGLFFLDGKHLNCAIALKKAEKLGPLDERTRLLLALSYVTIGKQNWARPEFERLAAENPKHAVYPYWLSRIAYRKTDYRSALTHAKEAVRLDPSFMKAYDQLGLCYDAAGEPDSAIAAFTRAIALNEKLTPRSPWPEMNLGTLLLRMERLEEAEAHLRASVETDARFPVAHYRLGQLLEKRQREDEAVAELEEAAKLDPTYPEPHYTLARIYRRRSDSRAAAELRKFQELRKADQQKGVLRPQ